MDSRCVLVVKLTKKNDGSSVLACTRPDGSSTWHRYSHSFFPLHDLVHFALETKLELRFGFYGLLASGWNITDFGERSIPGYAAHDAALAEAMAGLFDQERGTGIPLDESTFNDALHSVLERMESSTTRRVLKSELDEIRSSFLDLADRWARTAPGSALNLEFQMAP